MTQNEPLAWYGDVTAATVGVATIANALPSIAAVLSIGWFLIRIAESETVQLLLGRYRWINKGDKNGTAKD